MLRIESPKQSPFKRVQSLSRRFPFERRLLRRGANGATPRNDIFLVFDFWYSRFVDTMNILRPEDFYGMAY